MPKKAKRSRSSEAPTPESPSTSASPPQKKPPTALNSLLEKLKEKYPEVSTATLRQWIKFERIDLETLNVLPKKETFHDGIPIVYRDQHLIVINKPHKMLSVASDTDKHSLHQLVKIHLYPKKVGVIHRLDEGTSGLILFTLTDVAYHSLKEQFKVHSIERVYTALVEGIFPEDAGTWQSYLYEDKALKVHATDDPQRGEKAITHYKKIGTVKGYTQMEFRLETGKKNQIRVQTAAAGYPIAGDKKYGAVSDPLKRLALHAKVLGFTHPTTKKRIILEAQSDFKGFVH